MTATSPTPQASYLMWFRRDLRLKDNTAFSELTEIAKQASSKPDIKALFVATPEQWLEQAMSLVQMDFIFRNLKKLAESLFNQLNIELHVLQTSDYHQCIDAIDSFCQQQNISHIASNYEYEVNELARDAALEEQLNQKGIVFNRHHDQCILPPKSVTTNEDTMYKVFTPFYKKWQSILDTGLVNIHPLEPVNNNKLNPDILTQIIATIDNLYQQTLRLFLESTANQDKNTKLLLQTARQTYPAGENEAYQRLQQFLAEDVQQYDVARDQPALGATSKLSAYLAIGAISPRLCYLQAKQVAQAIYEANNPNLSEVDADSGAEQDIQRWISELAWRDFYRHVMADRPDIVKGAAFNKVADQKVTWSYDLSDFEKWCKGLTGVPLVDAAMRCLNQTGFMHNRLRMVTAMFLTKDLFIDWRLGERYFMQNLIDGDFASNNGGWQWSASTGTDAAPYFRIMNPFSQAKTHDKEAVFIKTWLPELKDIPTSVLYDEAKLRQALSKKGRFADVNYPQPMVEHKQARIYAIEQFKG